MATQTEERVSYPKLKQYSRLLCINTRTTQLAYRFLKSDILESLNAVKMDILFLGLYKAYKTEKKVICIAFNDEFVPQIIEQLAGRHHWFESTWISPANFDIEEFCWQHYVDYDPEVLAPIPAVRSSKSGIVITTGRLIRYDATEKEVRAKNKRRRRKSN